jgi:large subunit ribosomal protein L32
MPTPKRKVSKSRRDMRSACKGIKPKSVSGCQTCQAPILPHMVCQECGYYKGKKVLRTKTDRMYARGQARQTKMAQQQAGQPADEGGKGAAE